MNRYLRFNRHLFADLALIWGSLFFTPLVIAQALPDAGSIRQQIEATRDLPFPEAVPQPKGATKAPAGMTVRVDTFRFEGNSLLSHDQLSVATAGFSKREIGFEGLQGAVDAVITAYRQAGWIVRVSLPEQDISEGRVTLQITEARFSGYRFEGSPSLRVNPEKIELFFKDRLQQGQPLNANVLDRGLLLADDLPGVSVAGTLVAGQNVGATALVLQTTDEPVVFGDVSIDNHGARATGSQRQTVNLNVNSATGQGDLIGVNLLHTQGSDYVRLAWSLPVGHDGLRLGVNASALRYKVIEGPSANSETQIRGRSGSKGLDMSYPLLRGRLQNLYLSGGLENKTFLNQDSQVSADYESASWRLGLSGNRFDDLFGGGANSASLQFMVGRLHHIQAHSQINSIDRRYNKLTYSLSRQQTLSANKSLLLSLNGQHTYQVLDSSERIYIGGVQSVRAYPSSELGGELGQVLSAEWRWRMDPAWVLSMFADVGRVVTLASTAGESDSGEKLRGQGLSLAWQGPLGLQTKVTWAYRNGNNPKPSSTGTDSDGTLRQNRFWLSASLPF